MNIANSLLTIIAILLFIGFVRGSWSNGIHLWKSWVKKEEFPSPGLLPLVPGAMGTVALAIFPLYSLVDWRFLPLVLDLGCLPLFCIENTLLSWNDWKEWWLTRPSLLFMELRHEEPLDFKLVVALYTNGQVRLMKTNVDPRPYWISKKSWINESHKGTWSEENGSLTFKLASLKILYQKVSPSHYIWMESNRSNTFDKIDLEIAQ